MKTQRASLAPRPSSEPGSCGAGRGRASAPGASVPTRRELHCFLGDPMSLVIPDDVVRATRMSAADLQVEIAALLFLDNKLTLGQAAQFAGMNQPAFQEILGQRRISLHYDVQDFRDDVRTLDELREK